MFNRIIIGALVIIMALVFIALGSFTFSVVMGVITLISIIEMNRTIGALKNDRFLANIGLVYSAGLVLASVIGVHNNTLSLDSFSKVFLAASVLYLIALGICMVLRFDKTDYSLVTSSFFTTVYVNVMYLHLVLIRQLNSGEILVLMTILIAWLTDTCAYFSGRFLGKHKLIPNVSAKKTVEGAVGGTIGSVIIMVILAYVCAYFNYKVNYGYVALLTLVGAVISQFGDLIASCIKRQYDAKDYGSVLGGHGGFLDRFDSVLAVAPVVYYVCLMLPVITK